MEIQPSSFSLHPLLSYLWLHEPDAETIVRAVNELGLPAAAPAELASAYTDVFVLNVPPYGTVFTGPDGEMNGPEAQQLAALFELHAYSPPELNEVGAPDHVGVCLGFLAHLEERGLEMRDWRLEVGDWGFDWIPPACLAIEREPTAHAFYRALAATTRQHLFVRLNEARPSGAEAPSASSWQAPRFAQDNGDHPHSEIYNLQSEDEVRLHHIIRFFLAPARCGMFLSRSQMGRMAAELGLRLPFGSRFEVAERLFASAGETDQVEQLIAALEAEISDWRMAYRAWAEKCAAWRPYAEAWLARTAQAQRTLAEMQQIVTTTLT